MTGFSLSLPRSGSHQLRRAWVGCLGGFKFAGRPPSYCQTPRQQRLLKCGDRLLQLTLGLLVETPPTVWFQGRGDVLHDYKDADGNEPQRFVANYRKAGGEIALEYIDAERPAGHSPHLSKTGDMFECMVVFVHRHIKVM
jgi:acetyl esterase